MKIAIPVEDGRLGNHFGHCRNFEILETSSNGKEVVRRSTHEAPPHEPGVLPAWLAQQGADVIIAGGMGQGAQGHFARYGITVVLGAPSDTPEQLASAYLNGTLQTGGNACDHGTCHE